VPERCTNLAVEGAGRYGHSSLDPGCGVHAHASGAETVPAIGGFGAIVEGRRRPHRRSVKDTVPPSYDVLPEPGVRRRCAPGPSHPTREQRLGTLLCWELGVNDNVGHTTCLVYALKSHIL
jgi:hypothetical protein